MLECQGFEIKKIKRSDSLSLFKITDLQDQVFTVNQFDTNIYSIQQKISAASLATAVKKITAAKPNTKSKLKPNSEPTDSGNNDDNNNDDNIKKKRPIYEMM